VNLAEFTAETWLNYYDDTKTCYIGEHGDTERRKVIGVRVGETFPLHFRWYQRSAPISDFVSLELEEGDLYMMSEKAVGFDCKQRNARTLRGWSSCSVSPSDEKKPVD
jgi:hypothetical protein